MTQAICVDSLTYTYPSGLAVGPVSLVVNAGELVVLAGVTGCGKSTLVRCIAGLAQRHGHGRVDGLVRVGGRDPASLTGPERVLAIGFVGQEVDDCVLAGTCAGEVAFALESAGLPASGLQPALARLGLAGFDDRDPLKISGGERQRLAIAAALAARPPVLLLDEPLSQLDPHAARAVVDVLRRLADEGVAVLLVEHRLGLLEAADRVVWLGAGPHAGLDRPGHAAPDPVFHVEQGAAPPESAPGEPRAATGGSGVAPPSASPTPAIRAAGVGLNHGGARALCDVGLEVAVGERVAIVGGNGAGKSTLVGVLSGRLTPSAGLVERLVSVLEVPQNADLMLFAGRVDEELAYAGTELGLAPQPELAGEFGVGGLEARPPQSLSRGQRLRLAVGAAVAARPGLLLLDEAGSGQDVASLAQLFQAIAARSATLVFTSHDPALVRAWATRVVWLDAGRVRQDAPVRDSAWFAFVEGQVPRGRDLPGQTTPLAPAGPDRARSPDDGRRDAGSASASASATGAGGPRGLDPRLKILLVALLGVLVVALEGATPLVLMAGALLLLAGVSPSARGWRRGLLVGTALVAWSTAFSQSLFWNEFPRTALLRLGPLVFWREGAMHGLAQSTRFISLTAGGLLLALSTPTDELVTALRASPLPYPLVIMVAAMVRFVPQVAVEWRIVRDARRARGRASWRRPPWRWLALEIALLRPVVARSVRRARMLAESLETRGFDPSAGRALIRPLRWRPLDTAVLALALAVVVGVLVARGLFSLYAEDVWYDSDLRPLYGFVRAWM